MTGHPHTPSRLYHYTCPHGAQGIRRDGVIKTADQLAGRFHLSATAGDNWREFTGCSPLVWLTDLAPPVAKGWLGLTQHAVQCDRATTVFLVEDTTTVVWYMQYRKQFPGLRPLEGEPGAKPMHWFVAEGPVPVVGEALPDGTVRPMCKPGRTT